MKMKKILLTLVGCAAILGSAASYAAPGDNVRNQVQARMQSAQQQNPQSRLDMMAQRLNLTEDQKSQINTIMDQNKDQADALQQSMKDDKTQLMQLATAETYDADAVNKLATQMGDNMSKMISMKAEQRNAIYSVLDDSQKTQFKQMQENFSKKMHNRMSQRPGQSMSQSQDMDQTPPPPAQDQDTGSDQQ